MTQTAADATLSGVVLDPSGAEIAGATLTLHPILGGADRTFQADASGQFLLSVPAGSYTVSASAPEFARFTTQPMTLRAGRSRTLTFRLRILEADEQVQVNGDEVEGGTSQAGNSLVLKGDALHQLPLNPTELNQELQALAGGQNPEIWVNGFSGGSLPPRDTIREIRINQNPYSAMNDVNPVNGRIEIITKPGSNKVDASLAGFGSDNALNSRDLFAPVQPPYYTASVQGEVSGPLGKGISYFASGQVDRFAQNAVVNAQTVNSAGVASAVQQSVTAPVFNQNHSVRLDTMLGSRNTFSARYNLLRTSLTNAGVGLLVLPSAGFSSLTETGTLQLINSAVLSPHIVNDTRFQYIRSRASQNPNSTAPAVVVEGVLTGGGTTTGQFHDNQDRYELQNYTMLSEGQHYVSLGGRFRADRDSNNSDANFNGTYTFASLAAYAQALATGVGASQYSVTTGTPGVVVTVADLALFAQDDWKIRPTFTLSSGLRFETQNHIGDHHDFAPRLAFAWSLGVRKGKPPLLVLRGASGLFYQRLGVAPVLQAARVNGVLQQTLVTTNPQFFNPGSSSPTGYSPMLAGAVSPTVYQIDPRFHAPYLLNTTLILEHSLGAHGTVSASYLNTRGMRLLLTRNLNAPLPGTYNPAIPTSGLRPLGGTGNVYQYASEGISNSNRVSANFFAHGLNDRLFSFGYVEARRDLSDTTGGFPTNQYNPGQDYGRTPESTGLYMNTGIGGEPVRNLHAFLFLQARSGSPFNITLGQDLNGDSIFNDRPAFATDLTRPSVVRTAYGNFDTSPLAGQTVIPINFGTGPSFVTTNISISRSFALGPRLETPAATNSKGKAPPVARRFELDLGIDAQNALNHVNLAPPVGTLSSPLFGRSIALNNNNSGSANRFVNLTAYFHF